MIEYEISVSQEIGKLILFDNKKGVLSGVRICQARWHELTKIVQTVRQLMSEYWSVELHNYQKKIAIQIHTPIQSYFQKDRDLDLLTT